MDNVLRKRSFGVYPDQHARPVQTDPGLHQVAEVRGLKNKHDKISGGIRTSDPWDMELREIMYL